MSSLGLSGKVFVPTCVSSAKLKRLKQLKMSVVIHGNDCVDAENQGRKVADVIVTICKLLILIVCFSDGALARSGKPI